MLEEEFELDSYLVKGYKASGVRLTSKAIRTVKFAVKAAGAEDKEEKPPVETESQDSDDEYMLKF